MPGRRTLPALLVLGFGVPGAVLSSTVPAQAAPPPLCSVAGGILTVEANLTPSWHTVTVSMDSSGVEPVVAVAVDSEAQTCRDGADQPVAVDDLTSIVAKRDTSAMGSDWWNYMTGFEVDASFASYDVPVEVLGATEYDQATMMAFGQAYTISSLAGDSPAFDVDGDEIADVSLSGEPLSMVGFVLGSWNDSLDLSKGVAPATWSTWVMGGGGDDTLTGNDGVSFNAQGEAGDDVLQGGQAADDLRGGDGADDLQAGAGVDQVVPGGGADVVDTGAGGDTVTLANDGEQDEVLLGTIEDGLLYDDLSNGGVTVTANGIADDGTLGEQDSYGTFAAVSTGDGDDVIDALPATGGYVATAGGNDTVVASAGPDELWGGEGHDTISFARATAGVTYDQATGTAGADQAQAFESVVGSPYADAITVSADSATIRPGAGADVVDARGTFDTTFVAEPGLDGADQFTCSTGTVDYQLRTTAVAISLDDEDNDGAAGEGDRMCSDATAVIGGQGSDGITGNSMDNVLLGEGGADTINGRGGDDSIDGGGGANQLYGGSGADSITGGTGAEQLFGGDGEDRLLAGDGNDRLDGGAGDDDEYGEGGNDTLVQGSSAGANGSDVLSGGDGTDTVTYLGRAGGVRLSLNGLYDDGASGESDGISKTVENLTGTNGADTITGGSGANTLYGKGGNDTITGGAGLDKLYGDSGNDRFQAKDSTKDTVSGGTGTDQARRDAIDAISSIEGTF